MRKQREGADFSRGQIKTRGELCSQRTVKLDFQWTRCHPLALQLCLRER